VTITSFRRILSEEEEHMIQEPALHALADFVDRHGGEDLIRHLHAQDVEIVSHTTGALLKCYRTDHKDTSHPELCWTFFAGRYELDTDELMSAGAPQQATIAPAFTNRDYYRPIKHILSMTKAGKLNNIPEGTLVVVQTSASQEPKVRLHRRTATGNMVVVGVRYDITPSQAQSALATGRPGEIEQQAIKGQNRWESHGQLQRVASWMDTDSIPLFFRGKLTTTARAVTGMERSAQADPLFRRLVDEFLGQVGENPTKQDYERFFRRALQRFDEFDLHRLDREGKIEDRTAITKEAYRDMVERVYRRYDDVEQEIERTIEEYGPNSAEHQNDYRDLNYPGWWVRDQAAKRLFGESSDPITKAIEALSEHGEHPGIENVTQWVAREFQENGIPQALYRDHVRDERVPQGRQTGKTALWDQFTNEVRALIAPRLSEVVSDHTDS
jgi:hypothetical protein